MPRATQMTPEEKVKHMKEVRRAWVARNSDRMAKYKRQALERRRELLELGRQVLRTKRLDQHRVSAVPSQ